VLSGRDKSLPYKRRCREFVGRPALWPPRTLAAAGKFTGCHTVGGGVLDAPRRGQDPSLQGHNKKGRQTIRERLSLSHET